MHRELERSDEALFRRVPAVSGWSAAEQLYHVAVANGHMLTAVRRIVEQTEPARPSGRPTLVGRAVLLLGDFPRGRAKAPDRSVPPEGLSRETLTASVMRSRRVYEGIEPLLPQVAEATWRVSHPVFGWLDAGQWLRALAVHANHHFAIVDDILASPTDGHPD